MIKILWLGVIILATIFLVVGRKVIKEAAIKGQNEVNNVATEIKNEQENK